MIHTADGTVTTTTAAMILCSPAPGRVRVVRLITLYNPTVSALGFILRRIYLDRDGDERISRRWDDSMPATDSWIFGTLGGRIGVQPGGRLEVILDSSPATPVEYSIDYSDEPNGPG